MRKKLILCGLKGMARLPLGVLYAFSTVIGFALHRVVRYRLKVVRRNLSESFPDKSGRELRRIERDFYRHLGDVTVETVKLLHISEEEMARRVTVVNPEAINEVTASGRSAVLLLGHYANWEWVQQISRSVTGEVFKTSIYRPLRSRLWNEIFLEIRGRWGIRLMAQREVVRTLLDKGNRPWVCGFIADARPEDADHDNVTKFLNHPTSFVYGPELIGNKAGADFFFLEMQLLRRGYYRIVFHRLSPCPEGGSFPHIRAFWKDFERVVRDHPSLWLWSHNRWKKDRHLTLR